MQAEGAADFYFAEESVKMHTSGLIVGVKRGGRVFPALPSREIVTVDVNSGRVTSFEFSTEGVGRPRLAVNEETGEVYVYGLVGDPDVFTYPRRHKVFKIGSRLDSVLWEQTYEMEQVGEIDWSGGAVGISVEHMEFVPSDGRLVLVGPAQYPFRPRQPDTGGDPPTQPTATMYRIGAGQDERIRMPPSPEKREVAFNGFRRNDIGVWVLDEEDGRLVAARRFGSGWSNDEVVGVHAVGNGVLAFSGNYQVSDQLIGASSLALDKTDEGGLVGGGEADTCASP